MSYTKFVIVGQQRTGSTLLQLLLSSHSDVLSFGELFNPSEEIRQKGSKRIGRTLALDDDPIEYLENYVYRKYPDNIKAVGFRLFYTHARNDEWKGVWEYLRKSKERIIHLKRRNLLDRYLSLQLAQMSKKWIAFQGDPSPSYSRPITLNVKDCFRDFHRSVWFQNEVDDFFKDNPIVEVIYEDLAADPVGECRRIQTFLGLEVTKLLSESLKQQTKKNSEIIVNYDQLKKQLILGISKGWAKEEWLDFFEEA